MARIRTARILAAAASVPLAFALLGGVAQADYGIGNDDTNGIVNGQFSAGIGNSNQANNANVNGSGLTHLDQDNTAVYFTELW